MCACARYNSAPLSVGDSNSIRFAGDFVADSWDGGEKKGKRKSRKKSVR